MSVLTELCCWCVALQLKQVQEQLLRLSQEHAAKAKEKRDKRKKKKHHSDKPSPADNLSLIHI